MSKNPSSLVPMQLQLLKAENEHPDIEAFCRVVAAGIDPERAGAEFERGKVTLWQGRCRYSIRNNPARLRKLAELVSKCHGFNGKKTPKPVFRAQAATMYTHIAYGFKLAIPEHVAHAGAVTIGTHTLILHARSRTITGTVPASWLIDLNGAHPDDTEPATVTNAVPAPLPRVLYSEFIRSASKREAPMMA